MGGAVPVPARPERMVVGGGVFSGNRRARAVTGPIPDIAIMEIEMLSRKKIWTIG